jgi:hypothetical protein
VAQALLGFIRDLLTMTGDKKCIHFMSPVAAEQVLGAKALFATLVSFTAPAVVNGKLHQVTEVSTWTHIS